LRTSDALIRTKASKELSKCRSMSPFGGSMGLYYYTPRRCVVEGGGSLSDGSRAYTCILNQRLNQFSKETSCLPIRKKNQKKNVFRWTCYIGWHGKKSHHYIATEKICSVMFSAWKEIPRFLVDQDVPISRVTWGKFIRDIFVDLFKCRVAVMCLFYKQYRLL
jgi:hypothetical protein